MKKYMWDIFLRPKGKSILNSMCIDKIKHVADGSVKKYKAIFVARGFSQVEGIHYEEKFSPLDRYTSICIIISLAISMGWRLHQMDVKTTFLNGEIEEEFYIEKSNGFEIHEKTSHVYRLERALYGLKHEPRAWYDKIR
jgi:hypothetical protein